MIATLIDKQDNFEIVRDKIGMILADEVASQMALAALDGKDPDDWKLRIFLERSNPWEQFENDPTDTSPLVNVWYENGSFSEGQSNTVERQKAVGTYNIDCYGYGKSTDNLAGGHNPGDKQAAFEVQRAIRLVRNILMASTYTYLELRGTVWQRWVQSVTVFQPPLGENAVQNVVAARVAFRVQFNELSPQAVPEVLERVSVNVNRQEDGMLVAEADYEYPLT